MPSKHYKQPSTTDEAPLLLADEAFQSGITFNVKMIGSMDIPRPISRVEIVAAMRRVRLEYKSKGIKKRKVILSVGVNGVKTSLRIRKKAKHHQLKYRNGSQQREEITLQHHPIYRIFYVSHDSQDVKVFSYIARESSSNVFHCCVFKANKKNGPSTRRKTTMHSILYKQHSSKSQQQSASQQHSSGKSQGSLQYSASNAKQLQQLVQSKSQSQSAPKQPSASSSNQPRSTSKSHLVPTSQQQHEINLEKFLQIQQKSSTKSQQQRKKISFENQNQPPPIQSSPTLASPDKKIQDDASSVSSRLKNKQALRIVRTIGQAFEVSHKLNSPGGVDEEENGQRTATESPTEGSVSSQRAESSPALTPPEKPLVPSMSSKQRPPPLQNTWAKQTTDSPTEFKSHDHQIQLLKEQLAQESLNTQAAMSQLNLLREQLSTEMSARIEAENRNKQLLHHNKELLNHLHVLVQHIQELEGKPRDFGQLPSTRGSTSGSPQLTPRSKVERWFVLSSGGPFEPPDAPKVIEECQQTSTESGFVSQRNLLTALWKRVKLKKRRLRRWRQRSMITV